MRNKGFSLVELSIVLVILGLLVGGILAGQSLIRAAELRSVSTDIARYQTALMAFRDKYFALPGDMVNATLVWGKDTTSANACSGANGSAGSPGTCSGDGDGKIGTPGSEWTRAWQHLALAGLTEGQYSGANIGWGTLETIGTDIPASRMGGGGYSIMYASQSSNGEFGNAILPDTYYHWIVFAGKNTGWASAPILSTDDSWNLDTKMDDGLPFTGRLHAGIRTVCGASATTVSSSYALTNTTGRCVIAYQVN